MSQVVKAFMGIFFLMMLMLLGCGIVSAQMESVYARDYKAAVMAELSDSGCNRQVAESCMEQAKKDGYELEISILEKGDSEIAEVVLKYDYRIPFLNFSSRYELRGYAV